MKKNDCQIKICFALTILVISFSHFHISTIEASWTHIDFYSRALLFNRVATKDIGNGF